MKIEYRPRYTFASLAFAREFMLLIAGVLAYFGVRGLTEGSAGRALQHARWLIDVERLLGIHWEPALQRLIDGHERTIMLANWVYIWGHWPLIGIVGFWLYFRRPATYVLVRNAMFISGAIGLVIFVTFPLAPPRLTDLPMVDTVAAYSSSYRVLQPPAFVNQYAAMPSLHFGWDLLAGLALIRQAPTRAGRLFGLLMPVAMGCAVVLTANHYLLDVIAGGVVAMIGLYLARLLQARNEQPAAGATRTQPGRQLARTRPSALRPGRQPRRSRARAFIAPRLPRGSDDGRVEGERWRDHGRPGVSSGDDGTGAAAG